ncbi:hypothetical protein [Nitratireductor luteus]|uniref:hypothetical protein n=1 Tax=Nitratireductor luteus TaxID=2976980 RepID=UPI00223F476C|nr:hypothetical protein [Nitratireductor luteus]
MPPPDAQARIEKALLDSGRKGEEDGGARNWLQELARFRDETERVLDLLGNFQPEIRPLDRSRRCAVPVGNGIGNSKFFLFDGY